MTTALSHYAENKKPHIPIEGEKPERVTQVHGSPSKLESSARIRRITTGGVAAIAELNGVQFRNDVTCRFRTESGATMEAIEFTDKTKDRCFNFVSCGKTPGRDEKGRPKMEIRNRGGLTYEARISDWIIKYEGSDEFIALPDEIFFSLRPVPLIENRPEPPRKPIVTDSDKRRAIFDARQSHAAMNGKDEVAMALGELREALIREGVF